MDDDQATNTAFLERQGFYRGRAKVDLRHIAFEQEHVACGTSINYKNIARLVQVYRAEGCLRLENEHYIPVLIDNAVLTQSLAESAISHADLLDIRRIPQTLVLAFDVQLQALYGKHRIKAAEDFLNARDRWWVVELYDNGLPLHHITGLRADYANSRGFQDGDIYRHLRRSEIDSDTLGAGKWQARLSASKRKDIKVLSLPRHRRLKTAFDALLPFTGLWASVQLGTLHRVLSLNCDEELCHYLRHIHTAWINIMGDERSVVLLDSKTVHALQLLTPLHSSYDRNKIAALMDSGEIFTNIGDTTARSSVLQNLLRTTGRIPSLFTFFEDTKYLEPCAVIMKKILPPRITSSIACAFADRFSSAAATVEAQIEEGDGTWKSVTLGRTIAMKAAYLQLWLFTMRHFPYMQDQNPRKDPGDAKPQCSLRADLLPIFARLASRLGFNSLEINGLASQDPFRSVVSSFLRTARPSDEYNMNEELATQEVERICSFLHSVERRNVMREAPSIVTNKTRETILQRCGRPFYRSYVEDQPHLFVSVVFPAWKAASHALHFTSFGVKRDIILAFFGNFEFDTRSHESSPSPGPSSHYSPASRARFSANSYERDHRDRSSHYSFQDDTGYESPSIDSSRWVQPPEGTSAKLLNMFDASSISEWLSATPEADRHLVYFNFRTLQIMWIPECDNLQEQMEAIYRYLIASEIFVSGVSAEGATINRSILRNRNVRVRFICTKGWAVRSEATRAAARLLISTYYPHLDPHDNLDDAIGT